MKVLSRRHEFRNSVYGNRSTLPVSVYVYYRPCCREWEVETEKKRLKWRSGFFILPYIRDIL